MLNYLVEESKLIKFVSRGLLTEEVKSKAE